LGTCAGNYHVTREKVLHVRKGDDKKTVAMKIRFEKDKNYFEKL